ncbi:O-antigen ligase family protein [Chrysosporum ovalisporum FSS-45]|uniref:O-antigen ligase family protein n=1 Tax=Umezakia ovalisporum TaxID=75695 RepID=UPI002475994C|nr:O-antigen ligase family protein [Umezakia ovalisporum]MDH6076670.1 O-antigen ligase family protein [Umezakia ovalisporum FSS-45]
MNNHLNTRSFNTREVIPAILVAVWLIGILFALNFPTRADISQIVSLTWIIPFLKPWKVKELLGLPILRNFTTVVAFLSFFLFSFIVGVFSVSPRLSLGYLFITIVGLFVCAKVWLLLKYNSSSAFKLYSVFALLILFFLHLNGRFLILRNPNGLGLILNSIIACSYSFENLLFRLLLLLPSLFLLFATRSRASTLAAAIIILVQIYFDWQINVKAKYIVLSLTFLTLMVGLYLNLDVELMEFLGNYFELDNKFTGLESGFAGRTDVWNFGIDYWLNNDILFGTGYRVHELNFKSEGYTKHSSLHNGFLSTLVETGLVGSISMLIILTSTFTKLISLSLMRSRTAKVGLSLFLGYLFIAGFERFLINFGNPTSVLFAMFIVMPHFSCIEKQNTYLFQGKKT